MTATTPADRSWFGHPRGLSTLFFTEMWERFSYYGMRAFLILYMVHALGFDDPHAGRVYGNYVGAVWLTPILGGFVADLWLGAYRSVLVGGIIIALGHFTLAFHPLPFFYAGLTLIVIGTGLLKPNVSALVGAQYPAGDARRDAGFSIFYMGINFGAFIGPIIAGYLAQRVDWHLGFACAGVGMAAGVVQYILGKHRLVGAERAATGAAAQDRFSLAALTARDWMRIAVVVILFVFASVFWGAYEQAGSTLNLFADRYVDNWFPSSWYVSVQAFFVIVLSPTFAWLWVRLGSRQPSSPSKFTIALLCVAVAFLLLVPAGSLAQSGIKVSPLWLVVAYFVEELGEVCLYPVGLSVVTKLAPRGMVGFLLGVFFLSNSAGNKLAGWSAGFISSVPLPTLFGVTAGVCFAAAVLMAILIVPVKKMMGGVE